MWGNESLSLLIAEDSDEDFELLMSLFADLKIDNPVVRCIAGEEVFKTLEELPRPPGLILLDLNLIGLDGIEVLKLLKRHEQFRIVPVIILTTSSNPKDIERCYFEGASSYHVKPAGYERMETFVQRFKEYWLEDTILPRVNQFELVRQPYA